ncbi:MAG: hypothetical protein AB7Q97_12335 [Gammaproteobacteria bacterium]
MNRRPGLRTALWFALAAFAYTSVPSPATAAEDADEAGPATPTVEAAPPAGDDGEPPGFARYRPIFERPLFSPTRTPMAAPGIIRALPQFGAGARPLNNDFELVGVTLGPAQRRALIRTTRDRRTHAVGEGDAIADWRVEGIDAQHVVLRRGPQINTIAIVRRSGQTAGPATGAMRASGARAASASQDDPSAVASPPAAIPTVDDPP